MNRVAAWNQLLTARALDGLSAIPGITIYGPRDPARRTSLVAFNLAGQRSGRASREALDQAGIESRAGCHCATLAHHALRLTPPASCRLSFYLYNTPGEVDRAVTAVAEIAAGRGRPRAPASAHGRRAVTGLRGRAPRPRIRPRRSRPQRDEAERGQVRAMLTLTIMPGMPRPGRDHRALHPGQHRRPRRPCGGVLPRPATTSGCRRTSSPPPPAPAAPRLSAPAAVPLPALRPLPGQPGRLLGQRQPGASSAAPGACPAARPRPRCLPHHPVRLPRTLSHPAPSLPARPAPASPRPPPRFMIVASSGRIVPDSVHDHEAGVGVGIRAHAGSSGIDSWAASAKWSKNQSFRPQGAYMRQSPPLAGSGFPDWEAVDAAISDGAEASF